MPDQRYTQSIIVGQQITVADVLVANKSDQSTAEDFAALDAYLAQHVVGDKVQHQVSFGEIRAF